MFWKLKDTLLTVAGDDVSQAKKIAKTWEEREEGGPVTRTIFKPEVSVPEEKPLIAGWTQGMATLVLKENGV